MEIAVRIEETKERKKEKERGKEKVAGSEQFICTRPDY